MAKRAVAPIEYTSPIQHTAKNAIKAVIARDFSALKGVDVAIYKPDDYDRDFPDNFVQGDFEKYLYCPAFCTQKDLQKKGIMFLVLTKTLIPFI